MTRLNYSLMFFLFLITAASHIVDYIKSSDQKAPVATVVAAPPVTVIVEAPVAVKPQRTIASINTSVQAKVIKKTKLSHKLTKKKTEIARNNKNTKSNKRVKVATRAGNKRF